MFGYIYKTTNIITNKIYIGQKQSSVFLNNQYLGSGRYLKNAIKKYGEQAFKVELLEEIHDKDLMDEREKYWINFFNATNHQIGYNIASGGVGGDVWKGLTADDKHDRLCKREQTVLQRFGAKSPTKGRITINKDGCCKKIYPKDLDNYLLSGWSIGSPTKGRHPSEETRKKQSLAARRRAGPNTGRKLMYNITLQQHKMVLLSEVENHLKQGWQFGRLPTIPKRQLSQEQRQRLRESHLGQQSSCKGKIKINNGIEQKFIKPHELPEYLNNGWIKGCLPFSKEHRMNLSKGVKHSCNIFSFKGFHYVNDGKTEKRVPDEMMKTLISQGWVRGRIKKDLKGE